MDIQGMISQALGSGGAAGLEQAAKDHISSMDTGELTGHLQTAANNANAAGQPDVAQEIKDLASRAQTNPQALRDGVISYVKANPQVIAQYAPSFAQGILNRL